MAATDTINTYAFDTNEPEWVHDIQNVTGWNLYEGLVAAAKDMNDEESPLGILEAKVVDVDGWQQVLFAVCNYNYANDQGSGRIAVAVSAKLISEVDLDKLLNMVSEKYEEFGELDDEDEEE